MAVLINKLNHLSHKLHHESKSKKSLSISSQNFKTKLSNTLHQLFSSSTTIIHNNNLITIQLSTYPKLLHTLYKITNTAFTDLITELDYPITKWDDFIIDEYFSYTVQILKLVNIINSKLSNMRASRLALVHALSLIDASPSSAIKRLKPMIGERRGSDDVLRGGNDCRKVCDGKGKVIYEAVKEMESINLCVYGILLCGLGCKDVGSFGEGGGVEVKEVREVNEGVSEVVSCLVKGKGGEERCVVVLKRKLEEFQKVVGEAEKSVNCLFSEVLASRDQMLDCIRIR